MINVKKTKYELTDPSTSWYNAPVSLSYLLILPLVIIIGILHPGVSTTIIKLNTDLGMLELSLNWVRFVQKGTYYFLGDLKITFQSLF